MCVNWLVLLPMMWRWSTGHIWCWKGWNMVATSLVCSSKSSRPHPGSFGNRLESCVRLCTNRLQWNKKCVLTVLGLSGGQWSALERKHWRVKQRRSIAGYKSTGKHHLTIQKRMEKRCSGRRAKMASGYTKPEWLVKRAFKAAAFRWTIFGNGETVPYTMRHIDSEAIE